MLLAGGQTAIAQDMIDGQYQLIPYPEKITTTKSGFLQLNKIKSITFTNDTVEANAKDFALQLKKTSGIDLKITKSGKKAQKKAINLITEKSLPAEAYAITVDKDRVVVLASSSAGFFYALQTLKQLLPRAYFGSHLNVGEEWKLPYVNIVDRPALGHRGYMLDVARHFFNKNEIKRILDILSLYKINRFHWHLTDDQGWRIQIPEYPKLTEIGSIRSGSFVSKGLGTNKKFFDDTEYGRGMWFTLDDLREIVAYAKARHIEIIPEVDLPGHMVAAITAYPELSCDPTRKYSVRLDEGISKDVLNVGDDKVIDFLKCVLGHVAEIFPYKYIHIGGDECPTDQWKTNEKCLERVKKEGLAGVQELQSWLVEELGSFLKDKYGKDIVVWDELLSHWHKDNKVKPVIMAWNNIDFSAKAAEKGFKSIVVPYQTLYFDMMQAKRSLRDSCEIYYGGWNDNQITNVEGVYKINPLEKLKGKEEFCLGVQGNMWTETTNNSKEVEFQLLPRLMALSETAWLPASQKNWEKFLKRLQSHDEILDSLGYTYAQHCFVKPKLTHSQASMGEASKILNAYHGGQPGFAQKAAEDALSSALEKAKADTASTENLRNLDQALTNIKSAPILMPEEGKTYKIVSASSHYRKRYIGSTLYEKDGKLRIHYTPQGTKEELWQFIKKENGYVLKNVATGNFVSLKDYDSTAVASASGEPTLLNISKATIPTGNYSYIPGSVNISAADNSATSEKKKCLYANYTGFAITSEDTSLCNPGTWTLVEAKE